MIDRSERMQCDDLMKGWAANAQEVKSTRGTTHSVGESPSKSEEWRHITIQKVCEENRFILRILWENRSMLIYGYRRCDDRRGRAYCLDKYDL